MDFWTQKSKSPNRPHTDEEKEVEMTTTWLKNSISITIIVSGMVTISLIVLVLLNHFFPQETLKAWEQIYKFVEFLFNTAAQFIKTKQDSSV